MSENDNEHSLSGSENELMRIVGELALDLLLKRYEEVIADLPSDSPEPSQKETNDYIIEGKTVRFSSIEARNRCVAQYLFEKNRQAFANDSQMWLNTARDLWRHEIGKSDTAGGRLLALVHNIEDLFVIAANAIESGSLQVFDVLHVIVDALPYVNNVSVDGIFRLCIAQHEKTKNDLAAGMLFNKLEIVLEGQVANCRAIHGRLASHTIDATSSLHTCVLLALAKTSYEDAVTLALQDTQSSNELLKTAALWTLGRLISLPVATDEVIARVSAVIISNMSNPIERVRRTAIHAAAHATPSTQAFNEQLSKLGEAGDQDALAAIANILLLNRAEMKSKPIFHVWVRSLRKLSPASAGAVDYYDSVISELLNDENQQQFVISCLTDWATVNAKDIPRDKAVAELFDATIFKLANHKELLSEMITDWFISENRQLAAAAAGILSHLDLHGLKNAEFSTRRLDELEKNDLLFLARRMLGFVYSEDHLMSLTMSFLKTKDALQRACPIVNSLLVDELGQDHPSLTVETLETAKSSTKDKEWIAFYSAVIEKINNRMKALEALPRLSELRPPLSLQRQFERARTKQMSTAAEEAQKKSIIQQIATKIPLKAGKGWFSFRDGSYTEPSYLKSFSHAVSIPRRITLDLVGYEISRFMFRLAKRDQP